MKAPFFPALAVLGSLATLAVTALPASDNGQNRRYEERSEGIDYSVYEHDATNSKLSYVTNSGICETTPGINQYSGYLSVGMCACWECFFGFCALLRIENVDQGAT